MVQPSASGGLVVAISASGSPPSGALLEPGQEPASITEKDLALYEIDQAIDDVGGTFAAKVHVLYRNGGSSALTSLPLLLHANSATELGAPPGSSLDVRRASLDGGAPIEIVHDRPALVTLRLPSPVAPGSTVGFTVEYDGKLRSLPANTNDMFEQAFSSLGTLTGSGTSDYGLLAMGDGILTFACAYPAVAPYRDEQFDTHPPAKMGDLAYSAVARFKVRTVVPKGVSIVTNLVDGNPEPSGDNLVFRSEGSFVRDFVLVAGRDLERASKASPRGVKVTSVYRARDAKAGKLALETAILALASYEKRFGPYPYRELDLAEASLVGGAGGVEFSGMVLIAGMLYRPLEDSQSPVFGLMKMLDVAGPIPGSGASPVDPLAMIDTLREFTIDHEVAHQWFSALVGNDSHLAPSLDEPAAQYLAGLAISDRYGAAAGAKAMDANVKMNYALYRLLGGVDRPALRDTSSFRTGIEYAALIYGKAPYLYVALEKKLGAEKLHAAMRRAIARHRFELVSVDQWIAELDEGLGGGSTARQTFDRYLKEAHGDRDLGVDATGDFVIATLFPPELAATLRESMASLGMSPAELLKMALGGALGDEGPSGPGLDPFNALKKLQSP